MYQPDTCYCEGNCAVSSDEWGPCVRGEAEESKQGGQLILHGGKFQSVWGITIILHRNFGIFVIDPTLNAMLTKIVKERCRNPRWGAQWGGRQLPAPVGTAPPGSQYPVTLCVWIEGFSGGPESTPIRCMTLCGGAACLMFSENRAEKMWSPQSRTYL